MVWRTTAISAYGTFEKCRRTLRTSVYWGGPEVAAHGQNDAIGPRLCKNATFMVGQPPAVGPRGPVSCADRFHQSANAHNAHHPLHVVGQDVQRHFGTDVLECFHLEVRRPHPRLDCAEWMLDGLAAKSHLRWVSIEPRLYSLKVASCSQREIRLSFPVVHWPFSAQPWQEVVQ